MGAPRVRRPLAVMAIVAIQLAPAQAGTIQYSYDALGRLTQVIYPAAVDLRYSYDPSGNRRLYEVTGSPNPAPGGPLPVGQNKVQADRMSTTVPAGTSAEKPRN